MKHPIYSFSAVLRALRNEARLKPEDAAVRAMYPNYKRWESGRTVVRADYLALIAEAFGVEEELWLLLYAWLVDRLVPRPGQPAAQVESQLRAMLPSLPDGGSVDLGPVGPFVGGPITHSELAAGCFVARYGPGPSAPDEPIVLHAARRSKVLSPVAPNAGVLPTLYGEVLGEWMQFTALGGMLASVGQAGDERWNEAMRSGLAVLLAPGGLDQVATLFSRLTVTGDEHGLDRMPGVAAAELPALTEMWSEGMKELEQIQQVAARRPMSPEEFLSTMFELVQAGPEAMAVDDCPIDVSKLPDLDPTKAAEARAMFDRLDREFRHSVNEELLGAVAAANPAAAIEALVRVRRDEA